MPTSTNNEKRTKKKKKSSAATPRGETTTTTTDLTVKKKKKKSSSSSTLKKKPKRQQYSKLPSSTSTTTTTTTTTQEAQSTEKSTSSSTTSDYTKILTEKLFYYHSQLLLSYTQIRNALPHPTQTNTSSHRQLFTTATLVLFSLVFYNTILSPYTTTTTTTTESSFLRRNGGAGGGEYSLAVRESNGFFTDVRNDDWILMKQRVKQQQHYNDEKKGFRSQFLDRNDARTWYQNNWNADFTCPHELRVGGTGDGPKWVCDPHRIAEYYHSHPTKQCLIYSVNSNIFKSSNPFSFELGMQEILGDVSCEIHVFDPHYIETDGKVIPDGIIMHPWGIEGTKDVIKGRTNYMTLAETLHHLSHQRTTTIDILKVDCEECEWNAYTDWFSTSGGIRINQILVELHGTPKNDVPFFETLRENDYVIFHKEADTQYGGIWQEYGFLRLAHDFFE